MKAKLNIILIFITFLMCCDCISAAPGNAANGNAATAKATTEKTATASAEGKSKDTVMVDSNASNDSTTMGDLLDDAALEMEDSTGVAQDDGVYTQLKTKFMDGGVGFMSLVALCLIIGLSFCIERIVYLSMSEIDARKFMQSVENKLKTEGIEAAKDLCRDTRGPVASIAYQGLLRHKDTLENIERSVSSYASVQIGNMEKGCSWITLCIAMAPSLGFLGTVIGMVMAFDNIEMAGDIGPTIVASGMKVALITTIFGIITALILQLFYNYILTKIDRLTAQMEESAITLMDILSEEKSKK